MTQNSLFQEKTYSDKKIMKGLKEEIQKIKKPFLNLVQFSKLRIESKIKESDIEKRNFIESKEAIQSLIQKQSKKQKSKTKQQNLQTEQSQIIGNEIQKQQRNNYPKKSIQKSNKNSAPIRSYTAQWQGRDKQRIFKNSSAMIEQFQTIFNKKLPSNQVKKKQTYSYRKDQKQMLQRIFLQLKNPYENTVPFENIYDFFNQCQLFYQVYDINPAQLKDLVCSSAHSFSDKLTKKQFMDFFLINPQSKKFDEMQIQVKVQKTCCLEQQYWVQLKQLFSQLDTFGCGTVRTSQFFHKMKTISVSKQLLYANTIYYPNVNRYYSLKKVIFELENKINLPQKLQWSQLQNQIKNFSHIDFPSIDETFEKSIRSGAIEKDGNTFLLKSDTISILKKQFERCPKFCQSFVKCKFFCEQLLQKEAINCRKNESVRPKNDGKGFVNLLSNIKMLQLKGPQYFDMDQMLIYFSVKGFQQEQMIHRFKQCYDSKSTASDQEFQERKREQRRAKRMKSQDQIKKVMMKSFQQIPGTQRKKSPYTPVKIKEFNLTKPRDYLTIRETKVKEMIEQKKLKQEAEIKPFISAIPLPASINSQRYQEEQKKIQLKRQLEKQRFSKKYEKYEKQLSYLQATTQLFQKKNESNIVQEKAFVLSPQKNKMFEPKPISWFVKERNLLQIIQGEKQERRKNRLKQTREKYQYGYWKNLPYQIERDQNLSQCIQNKNQDSLDIKVKDIQDNNHKKTQKVKTTVVPDFAKLQKQFQKELESRKKMISPTIVKQFNLSVSKKRPIQIQQQNLTKRTQKIKKQKENLNFKHQTPVIIGTTKKYESMVELTQMKIAQKNYDQQLKRQEQKQRKKKQKAFAKFMNKVLREQSLKSKRYTTEKTTRRNDSSSRREHQSQLRKIYEKVLSRPFLFQTATQESNRLKKQGKNSKKSKRSKPQKVKIPSDEVNLQIPALKYIDSEQYPAQYADEREHQNDQYQEEQGCMVNQFQQEDSNLQQQESYIQQVIPNQGQSYKRNDFAVNLNQSF